MHVHVCRYNTASAVSDANFIVYAKLPCTLRQFKMVNDASIWSGNFTTFATFFLIYRVAIDLTEVRLTTTTPRRHFLLLR